MPKGWIGAEGGNDLTLLGAVCLCSLASRASDGRNADRKTLLYYMPPTNPASIPTWGSLHSWLLFQTIRSPLIPSILWPGMYYSSLNITTVLGQKIVINQDPLLFSFASSRLLLQMWISQWIWGSISEVILYMWNIYICASYFTQFIVKSLCAECNLNLKHG